MNLEQKKNARKKFEEAVDALESLDPNLLRSTEQDMRSTSLKCLRHSIGRLDGMIECEIDSKVRKGERGELQ